MRLKQTQRGSSGKDIFGCTTLARGYGKEASGNCGTNEALRGQSIMCCMARGTNCRTLMIERSTSRSRFRYWTRRFRVTVLTATHCVDTCRQSTRCYRVTVLTETRYVECCRQSTRCYRITVLTKTHCKWSSLAFCGFFDL